MLGALSRTFLIQSSKLPKLRCLGSDLLNYSPPTSLLHNENRFPVPGREPSNKTKKLQTLDGVPLSYETIYHSHKYHTIAQHGCTALSGGFALVSAVQIMRDFEEIFPDAWTTALNLWVAAIYFYVNIGTAFITYRSPVRIYFNKKTGDYIAIFNNLIPTKIRTLNFRKGDVDHLPPGDELSLFRYSRFKIKDTKLYMLETFFRYPGDMYGMFDEVEGEAEDDTA